MFDAILKSFPPERRASVEQVFGLIKLQGVVVRECLFSTRDNTILCRFLWYNYSLFL